MCRLVASTLLALPLGCATSQSAPSSVLATKSYFLVLWSHCAEGEVDCRQLTGDLVPADTNKAVHLTGSTRMVACAGGATPCHVGYYAFTGAGFSILAYPDGTLEVTPPSGLRTTEKGTWRY